MQCTRLLLWALLLAVHVAATLRIVRQWHVGMNLLLGTRGWRALHCGGSHSSWHTALRALLVSVLGAREVG